jgi:hypothetical protein
MRERESGSRPWRRGREHVSGSPPARERQARRSATSRRPKRLGRARMALRRLRAAPPSAGSSPRRALRSGGDDRTAPREPTMKGRAGAKRVEELRAAHDQLDLESASRPGAIPGLQLPVVRGEVRERVSWLRARSWLRAPIDGQGEYRGPGTPPETPCSPSPCAPLRPPVGAGDRRSSRAGEAGCDVFPNRAEGPPVEVLTPMLHWWLVVEDNRHQPRCGWPCAQAR